jgi:hypothetical protein
MKIKNKTLWQQIVAKEVKNVDGKEIEGFGKLKGKNIVLLKNGTWRLVKDEKQIQDKKFS